MKNPKSARLASLTSLLLLLSGKTTLVSDTVEAAGDVASPAEVVNLIPGDKAGEDPFMGDWQGKWSKGFPAELVAQVIPRGGENYVINFLPAFDQRCPAFAMIEAKADGKELRFDQAGWSGRIRGDRLTGTGIMRNKPAAFALKKVARLSPRLGAKPPEGAVVLFDGGDLSQWESDGRGGVEEIQWQKIDDFLRVWPPLEKHVIAAGIRTRRAWPRFQLDLEFRLPLIAAATGQTRGNSGVIIEDFEFYEVQILDSYGLSGYWDECGAIYKKEAPKVNMAAPNVRVKSGGTVRMLGVEAPLQWQQQGDRLVVRMPATNYRGEQAVRLAVVNRKVWGGNQRPGRPADSSRRAGMDA